MSIRFKILLPMVVLALGALVLSGLQMWFTAAQSAQEAAVTERVIRVGEKAREAREGFDRLDDLTVEVTAMTHFVDPADIKKRYGDDVDLVAGRLDDLKREALSPEMERLAHDMGSGFEAWRRDAALTLGVERSDHVPVADEIGRKRDFLKEQLVRAINLAAEDARRSLAKLAERQRVTMGTTLALALAFGAAAGLSAWRLANNLSRPILALVASAGRLAKGDVSVTFEATDRRDEIGDVARAVAAFRDNVNAAQNAAAAAADERRAGENMRQRNEAQRTAVGEEQTRVVDALSEGLERLARGDLTWRVEGEFSPTYARLKTNFNKSLDVLQNALTSISEGARELQAGSSEIAGLASDLSARTGSQTASIEEAAAALEEITTTVRATADNAGQARKVVSNTRGEAEKSGAVVRTAVEAIGRIQNSSQEIEKIIGVIDEIAFQTNLLALNAGVEAARAGETGRGFAVVATEVRGLAQRSAQASKEIKALISTSSAQVKEGVDLVVSAGAALDRIFAQVSEIDRVVGAIAGGAAEQSTGLQSVNRGVSQIDRANQSNVDIVERTTSACANVADRAAELADAVALFKVDPAPAAPLRRAA